MNNFTVGKIRRSLQRFMDFACDLSSSDMNTFDDRLSLLMNYCLTDDVFKIIDFQLTSIDSVNFDAWYKERKSTIRSMVGSGQLLFPTNLDERLSLMYQLLHKINNKQVNFDEFVTEFFAISGSQIDSFIYAFNDAIVKPLSRELAYRFEELEETLPEDKRETVPLSNVQIIHNAHTVIQQSANGYNINQSASVENITNVQRLFQNLKQEIHTAIENEGQRNEALEIVESAEVIATTSKPKPAAIKALLNSLPSLGNIASLVSAILAAIAMLG